MAKNQTVEKINIIWNKIRGEIKKEIVGQDDAIDHILIALFCGGHILIEGVPGLAKTLMANVISHIIGATWTRIQFTPDLMPADIIGTTIYNSETNKFQIKHGPVFTDILLADEINRSPAKTQSALLEAMQERQVTIDGKVYPLDPTFLCIATQNPIEMEGTYPLPEAQLDRFFMKIFIKYPSQTDENEIIARYRSGFNAEKPESSGIKKAVEKKHILAIRDAMSNITCDDKIVNYITSIIQRTRNFPGIEFGASPRGSISLFLASRVRAACEGRDYVIPEDCKFCAPAVLRHRIILNAESEIANVTCDDILSKIISEIEVPR